MDLNVGEFKISSIETDSNNLIETASDAQIGHGTFDTRISRNGNAATAEISTRKAAGISGTIKLTKQIPLSLSLNAGVSVIVMDLSSLQVSQIIVKADAGHYVITMPETGNITAAVNSGLGNIEIIIPNTIAARIQLNSADMTVIDINQKRFLQNGNAYTSANFDTAERRIELKIESAIGRVSIKWIDLPGALTGYRYRFPFYQTETAQTYGILACQRACIDCIHAECYYLART